MWFLVQINVIFVFFAWITEEVHYIYYISRITIFTHGNPKISIFSIYFYIKTKDFFQNSVIQLPLPFCIYVSYVFWNTSNRWSIIHEILLNFARNAIVRIDLEIFSVFFLANKRYIRFSRTEYRRTTLSLLKYPIITIFTDEERKNSVFSKYFQIQQKNFVKKAVM